MENKDQILNPQQQLFLELYCNPKSETFSDAYHSALKANYTESYAKNVMYLLPDWLSDNIGDMKRLRKAEKLMDKIMDLEPVSEEGQIDNSLISNQIKVVTLLAKGVGKNKYSERTEVTGKNGGALQINSVSELTDEQLASIIRGSNEGVGKEGASEETP